MSTMHRQVERMLARLDSLYDCGRQADGSHTRMAFSPEDRKGRALFSSWFEELGIPVRRLTARVCPWVWLRALRESSAWRLVSWVRLTMRAVPKCPTARMLS